MPFFFIFLIFIVITALVLGWLVVCIVAGVLKLTLRIAGLPFRLARRADAAVLSRLQRPLPIRIHRGDDVQCTNRICRARLPIEARFCARCGGALPARRMPASSVLVDVRRHGYSQVARDFRDCRASIRDASAILLETHRASQG